MWERLSFPYRGTEPWGNLCLQRDIYPASSFKTAILLSLIFLVLLIQKSSLNTEIPSQSNIHHRRSVFTTKTFCKMEVPGVFHADSQAGAAGLWGGGCSQQGWARWGLVGAICHWAQGGEHAHSSSSQKSLWEFPSQLTRNGTKKILPVALSASSRLHCPQTWTLWGEICDTVLPFCSQVLHCFPALLINSQEISLRFGFLVFFTSNLSCRAQFIKQETLPRGSEVLKKGEKQYYFKLWVHTKHSHSAGVDIRINSLLAIFQMA